MTLAEAIEAVKAGKTVTREDPHWREHLRWDKDGLYNANHIGSGPAGICLMHDDVFADDWMIAVDDDE